MATDDQGQNSVTEEERARLAAEASASAEEEAAFRQSYTEAMGFEPPTPEEEGQPAGGVKATTDEPGAATGTGETPGESPAATPEIFGLSQDQFDYLMAQADGFSTYREQQEQTLRKIFGKLGEVNNILTQLRTSRPAGFKMPDKGLQRLAAEFPEMARSLQDDLNEVLSQMSAPASAPFSAQEMEEMIKPKLDDTLSTAEKRVELRLLRREHPDWKAVTESDPYRFWKERVLPPDQAEELDESWDADLVGKQLTAFKAWRDDQKKRAASQRTRLERAIDPTRGTSEPTTEPEGEEAAFLAGFNTVAKRA